MLKIKTEKAFLKKSFYFISIISMLAVFMYITSFKGNIEEVYALGGYGDSCSKHTDCQYGMFCLTGGCFFEGCQSHSDCRSGLYCDFTDEQGYKYCTYKKTSTTTTTPTKTKTPTKPAPPKIEYAPIASAKLPKEFIQEGSKSTNLSKIEKSKAKSQKDFTLDSVNGNMIVWTEEVDLSADELKTKFTELNRGH